MSSSISATPSAAGRTRLVDRRSAPKSVSQEVSRFLDLQKACTVAKLQDSIAQRQQCSRERVASTQSQPLDAPRAGRRPPPAVKYPIELPLDIAGDRQRRALIETLQDNPEEAQLDSMLVRVKDRRQQSAELEAKMAPDMIGIGVKKEGWEYQLMLCQRHSDDGEFLGNEFFEVLDSKAAVSDALHRHHSTAEIRAAATNTFGEFVDEVQTELPITKRAGEERMREMQREQAATDHSARTVDDMMRDMAQGFSNLNHLGENLESVSKKASWAASHKKSGEGIDGRMRKMRHVGCLTDMSFSSRLMALDSGEGEEDDESADELTPDAANSRKRGGRNGRRSESSADRGGDSRSDEEHNQQLLALEQRLSTRYDAMMALLAESEAERRSNERRLFGLLTEANKRDEEVIALRATIKGLLHGEAFTELWHVEVGEPSAGRVLGTTLGGGGGTARAAGVEGARDVQPHRVNRGGAAATARQEQDVRVVGGVVADEHVLHRIVSSCMEEARSELLSLNGVNAQRAAELASAVFARRAPGSDSTKASTSSAEAEAQLFREVNDLRKKAGALEDQVTELTSDAEHREELYQRLKSKEETVSHELEKAQQLLVATEKERADKASRLVDAEQLCRELQTRLASYDREKAEEIHEIQRQHLHTTTLLERRLQDAEKELEQLQQSKTQQQGGEESPEVKLRKANAKMQELELQQRSLRGLNGALEGKVADLKEEVKQLLSYVTGLIVPFRSHMQKLREHVQNARQERMLDLLRSCVWGESDEVLLGCCRFTKLVMKHFSDPLLAESVSEMEGWVTKTQLSPVEEDPQRKALAAENERLVQANRTLTAKLRRAHDDMAQQQRNKSHVVDAVRGATDRLSMRAAEVAESMVDFSDVPLPDIAEGGPNGRVDVTGEDDDDADTVDLVGLGDSKTPSLHRRGTLLGSTPLSSFSAFEDDVDAAEMGDIGTVPSARPLQRKPSQGLIDAACVPSGNSPSRTRSSEDPSLEPAALMATQQQEAPPPTGRRSVFLDGARRRFMRRSSSVVGAVAAAGFVAMGEEDAAATAVSTGSLDKRRSSVRIVSAAHDELDGGRRIATTSPQASGSQQRLVGRLFEDDATQKLLDDAFQTMQDKMDAAVRDRDLLVSDASVATKEAQDQVVAAMRAGEEALAVTLRAAREATLAVREASEAYAASVLTPILAQRDSLWISQEAEAILVNIQQVPKKSVPLLVALAREAVLHQVRHAAFVRRMADLKQTCRTLGDEMVRVLWRRRWYYRQRRFAATTCDALRSLRELHSARFAWIAQLQKLVPITGNSRSTRRVATPPPSTVALSLDGAAEGGNLAGVNEPLHLGGKISDASVAATAAVVNSTETSDCSSMTDVSPEQYPILSLVASQQVVAVATEVVRLFCEVSAVGEHAKREAECLEMIHHRRGGEDDGSVESSGAAASPLAWLSSAAPECSSGASGLLHVDRGMAAVKALWKTWAEGTLRQLAAFQRRVESESYMRFVAPPSDATESGAAGKETGLGSDSVEALQQLVADLNDTVGAVGENDSSAILEGATSDVDDAGETDEGRRMRRSTSAAVDRLQHKLAAAEKRSTQVEATLRDTKVALRKVLRDIAADRFAHIETLPLRPYQQRKALLGEKGGQGNQRENRRFSPVPPECAVCGCVPVVSARQLPMVRCVEHPVRLHACTETDWTFDTTTATATTITQATKTSRTSTATPSHHAAVHLPEPTPSLYYANVPAKDGGVLPAPAGNQTGGDGDTTLPGFIPFVSRPGAISPIAWNADSPVASAGAAATTSPDDGSVPKQMSDVLIVVANAGLVEASCQTVAATPLAHTNSSATQTDEQLLALLLHNMLAMVQEATDAASALGQEPSAVLHDPEAWSMTSVAAKIQRFSSAARRNMVEDFRQLQLRRGVSAAANAGGVAAAAAASGGLTAASQPRAPEAVRVQQQLLHGGDNEEITMRITSTDGATFGGASSTTAPPRASPLPRPQPYGVAELHKMFARGSSAKGGANYRHDAALPSSASPSLVATGSHVISLARQRHGWSAKSGGDASRGRTASPSQPTESWDPEDDLGTRASHRETHGHTQHRDEAPSGPEWSIPTQKR